MQYQTLTPAQQSQVEYLFADQIFGTDATGFEYEVKAGNVIARSRIAPSGEAEARKPKTVRVHVAVREIPTAYLSVEMDREANYAIQAIARSLIEQLIKSQTLEAHHGKES